MREALIDTNVLVYDTFEDSVYHEASRRLLDGLSSWLLPLIVVYEYVWFLRGMRVEPAEAYEKVLEYVLDEKARLVREGLEDIRWALAVLREEELSLSRFNDKLIVLAAKRRGVPLATFDDRLRRQAARLGVPLLPADL